MNHTPKISEKRLRPQQPPPVRSAIFFPRQPRDPPLRRNPETIGAGPRQARCYGTESAATQGVIGRSQSQRGWRRRLETPPPRPQRRATTGRYVRVPFPTRSRGESNWLDDTPQGLSQACSSRWGTTCPRPPGGNRLSVAAWTPIAARSGRVSLQDMPGRWDVEREYQGTRQCHRTTSAEFG